MYISQKIVFRISIIMLRIDLKQYFNTFVVKRFYREAEKVA